MRKTELLYPHQSPSRRWIRFAWAFVAVALSLGIVSWEYLLNTILNPEVNWNLAGVTAHMGLDVVLVLPVVALALWGGLWLSRRLGMKQSRRGDFFGIAAVVALLLVALMLPVTSGRDVLHEWLGQTYGLFLAEVRTTVVTSELTVQEATQLCSFSSVNNPSLARDGYQDWTLSLGSRVLAGARQTLVQLVAFLPLLLAGLLLLSRRQRRRWQPAPAGLFPAGSLLRGAAVAFALLLSMLLIQGLRDGGAEVSAAQVGADPNSCEADGPVKEYNVSAIDVTITLNAWGDHVESAYMYALNANIPAIRAFEQGLEEDRELAEGPGVRRVSPGLRKDPIQPLVIRANLGDCLRVNFTNALNTRQRASMHILGLPHEVDSAGSAVGNNPDTMAAPGQTLTYEIPIPNDPNAERAYYFHDHGAGRRRQNMGLFGAIVVEPRGATYLDVETGEPLDTETGSNWEAIIIDPNVDNRSDGKSFREFVIFYHEIGTEAFTDIRDRDNFKVPLVDELAGVYRPGARALNYRSEPFRNRIAFDEDVNGDLAGNGKALGYASYPFGDPATPIPRSYVGEGVKTRLLHGGSEVFHVHHLHGGGDRWRRNPNADPNNDFWKGLTKVPNQKITSIHLDSQSIGPGTSYNLEHECGAGGCQQGVGEFLYHCHIGHHYIAGMWSFWRVFGTVQDEDTNIHGNPLAVVPDLFQADNPFSNDEAPSNTLPEFGVSAGELIGLAVDDGRVIVPDADLTDPGTEIGLLDWISSQLPPPGEPIDARDATVWNWVADGQGAATRILGEPDEDMPFPGWVSDIPGQRPEVLFNPKNGRYTWPLFRPQAAARPPFTARHTGAPWLGEEMNEGRIDGLCAVNGVHPAVDVGETAVKRFYPVSAITLPIQVTRDKVDAEGQIFVLNEIEEDVREGRRPAEPLAIRSNVGDCVEIILTNKIPDAPINKNFSKVNIHSHFVQFDTQASDGVITGFSYEQSVRPIESEGRHLTSRANAGDRILFVNHVDRLRPGIWLGIGLGEATCGVSDQGQPLPCTEIRRIVDIPDDNTIVLDEPLVNAHSVDEAVGVEFVRYHWYSDVDFGTVFFHTHVEFKDWDRGLFGAHIVEPKGSTYHDPVTGQERRQGTLVDVRVDPAAGGEPVAAGANGSFREFMLFLHNNSPVEGRFTQGGGTINLRAEPWRLRDGADPAYRFSSVMHDDPHTQVIEAYVGDPVVVRGMGLVERVGGIRFLGHRFHQERNTAASDTRDTTFIGISERFDFSLEGGAGGPGGFPGDYLYYSTLGKDFESGAWGLLRVFDRRQGGLQPLPDRGAPVGGGPGFPRQRFTGEAPEVSRGPGNPCPGQSPLRTYQVTITDAEIIYNDFTIPDFTGTVYRPREEVSDSARTPLVLRANSGDCVQVTLKNDTDRRAGFSLGELLFRPQQSYGGAVGFNLDSTVAPGRVRTYKFFADRELGTTIALNLGDIDSAARGAFAALVVEPRGSQYFRPGTNEPLPQGGIGVQADVVTPNSAFREFVALFNDNERQLGQNAMPYPELPSTFTGINYSSEPLRLRDAFLAPDDVFRSDLWGDPRHVVTVPAGTPLVYRVAQPWGHQVHVPTLEGHRWFLEPRMDGSEQVFDDVLAPAMSLDLIFVGGAGGDIAAPGDYLFLDRRQPFLEAGLWNILRVTDNALQTRGQDSVVVLDTRGGRVSPAEVGGDLARANRSTALEVEGLVGILPAGDTVDRVHLYSGASANGVCSGTYLGDASVDPGSGRFTFRKVMRQLPEDVCVQSAGGGMRTERVRTR
ncbi:MAG TPA: multicopper oxidase domain-containing protein [Acidobacteriota bacterium]|nr:multicopper oxidase domain-containing protein [Acidobacteriota bacterium]